MWHGMRRNLGAAWRENTLGHRDNGAPCSRRLNLDLGFAYAARKKQTPLGFSGRRTANQTLAMRRQEAPAS